MITFLLGLLLGLMLRQVDEYWGFSERLRNKINNNSNKK